MGALSVGNLSKPRFSEFGTAQIRLVLVLFLIGFIFVSIATSLFNHFQNSSEILSSSTFIPKVTDDTKTKRVTVETENTKVVFYYAGYNTEPNKGNESEGGGNIYELYYKPTDKLSQNNLVAKFPIVASWVPGVAVGAGGIGNSQAYFLHVNPATTTKVPYCNDKDKACEAMTQEEVVAANDYVSDNREGYFESYNIQSDTPKKNWTTLTFIYAVNALKSSNEPSRPYDNKLIYRVKKIWKISPSGNIYHLQRKAVRENLWMAEVGFRVQWNMERGWDTLRKWGHVAWARNSKVLPHTKEMQEKINKCIYGVDGFSGNSNSPECQAVSEFVTLKGLREGTNGRVSECFLPQSTYSTKDLLLFQPTRLVLKGAPTAPDVQFVYDNNGRGFSGGGIWQALQHASQTKNRNAYMEQCVHDRRGELEGSGEYARNGSYALHYGFFSSAGGNEATTTLPIAFTLYCVDQPKNQACKDHLLTTGKGPGVFIDTFTIKLKRPPSQGQSKDSADNSGFYEDNLTPNQIFTGSDLN